ncbi:hypothetical protein GCM10010112_26210 [Actinoplanes lobatus]|uniref:Uncharacterized protein n=1 Tax=Actinoplanes lobatus TaxID=113568 RepID=A0ABQ4AQX6_9ACTN|nr:hypothetical protein GCM10010112_26210 [Actinoplanes lobatus]GIE43245.1 hypothetical protein Alo02nite_61430 [Actinoplanes lobatus]
MTPGTVLVVGPRVLPADGWADVWIDSGSGHGYVRRVPAEQLSLAPLDDGEGESAIYRLHPAVTPLEQGRAASSAQMTPPVPVEWAP